MFLAEDVVAVIRRRTCAVLERNHRRMVHARAMPKHQKTMGGRSYCTGSCAKRGLTAVSVIMHPPVSSELGQNLADFHAVSAYHCPVCTKNLRRAVSQRDLSGLERNGSSVNISPIPMTYSCVLCLSLASNVRPIWNWPSARARRT